MTVFNFKSRIPIAKGWSDDKKYCVSTAGGKKFLLRISPKEQYSRKKVQFEMMQRVASLGVPMCQPIEFGVSDEGVYTLQSWIEGKDAKEICPFLSDAEQYEYGIEAGRILKKIHSVPISFILEDWEHRFNRKINRKIQMYSECQVKYENGQAFIDYINASRHLLKNRPQVFQHGDYHIGNMMVDINGKLQIIDFDRYDFGDPWEEFNRIVWSAQYSPLFASGIVNGYFDNEVPMEFWHLLALYISSNTLSSVPWAIPFGQSEIDTMLNQSKEVLQWYDNMKNPVPAWYRGYYLQYIDGLPYKIKAPFDFGFIGKYGKVFKIFDDQDSGNICFGCEKNGDKFFIKFAGAPTERGYLDNAVARLEAAVPIYRILRHPGLIDFIKAEETGGGFAMVFRWADGECMGRMYPRSRRKFMQSDINTRLGVYRDILSFFKYITSLGYVAVDFYDGSIMYDFETHKTTICDIDFFRKMPCINDMGRMWGSSRFMSPEEYQLGAALDEVTNVFTLGATAFALFSDYSCTAAAWPLGEKAFTVAAKAVSDKRSERQQSIRGFIDEWEAAL
jgi:serine/threonine-protein kinase